MITKIVAIVIGIILFHSGHMVLGAILIIVAVLEFLFGRFLDRTFNN